MQEIARQVYLGYSLFLFPIIYSLEFPKKNNYFCRTRFLLLVPFDTAHYVGNLLSLSYIDDGSWSGWKGFL